MTFTSYHGQLGFPFGFLQHQHANETYKKRQHQNPSTKSITLEHNKENEISHFLLLLSLPLSFPFVHFFCFVISGKA
jgi:hypothetical protein